MLILQSEFLRSLTKRGVVAFTREQNLRKLACECIELALTIEHHLEGKRDDMDVALEGADVTVMLARLAEIVGVKTWDGAMAVKLAKAQRIIEEQERARDALRKTKELLKTCPDSDLRTAVSGAVHVTLPKPGSAEELALLANDTFVREDLADAIAEVTAVLDGHGLEKYGARGWHQTSTDVLREKLRRHLDAVELDRDSGRDPLAHAAVRVLQLLQRRIGERRGNGG